jgi:amidase
MKLVEDAAAPRPSLDGADVVSPQATRREFVSMVVSLPVALGGAASAAKSAETGVSPVKASSLVQMRAVELANAIRAKTVSCVEVMTAFLDHIERINPHVNAIVSLQDRADLLRQATERDAQLARGQYLGWLHGFPHAVKDLAATQGIRTTGGSPLLDGIPTGDAIFVERLKARGAIIIGKTNTPEFGLGSQTYNTVFGATRNAYDQSKTSGGSSGGAAVSLALRMVPVADGSDMMGSLRNPGAFNNVFGFRPSNGRIPAMSDELFLNQLATTGAMGRGVADIALLMSVMAGPDARDPTALDENPQVFQTLLPRDLQGKRLGWLGDLGGHLPFEPGILELCTQSFAAFESLGCTVEAAALGFPPERIWETWLTLRHWLVGGGLQPLYADPAKRARMKPEAQWEIAGALRLRALDAFHASQGRTSWYRAAARLFEKYDYLLLPSAQVFPFDASVHWPKSIHGVAMDTYHRWMEVVVPASLLGHPVLNVPVGFGSQGLPMGMQIIGRHHADLSVLQLGFGYEQATGWVGRHLPPLLASSG